MVALKVSFVLALAAAAFAGPSHHARRTLGFGDPTGMVNGFWDGIGQGFHSAVDSYIAVCRAPFNAALGMIGGQPGTSVTVNGGAPGTNVGVSAPFTSVSVNGGPQSGPGAPVSGPNAPSGSDNSPTSHSPNGNAPGVSVTTDITSPQNQQALEQQLNLIIVHTTDLTTRIEAIKAHPPRNGRLPNFDSEVQPVLDQYNQIYSAIDRSPNGALIRSQHKSTLAKFDQSYHTLQVVSQP